MRKIVFLTAGILASYLLFAQTNGSQFALPTVIPNAPQSSSLGRYGEIPVSVNTGVPGISIPLLTVQSGKLAVPITIQYHGSGIKVMDKASPSGLGWSLNTGGDIARVVQGLEDENANGFSHIRFPDQNDPAFYFKERCLAGNITFNYQGAYPWDGQPDIYYYSFGGKAGQFIQKNAVSDKQAAGFMTIPYSPVKIQFGPLAGNALPTIQITDVDGTQYTFGPYDSSYVQSNITSTRKGYPITTAWHLVKILSANKADSITFVYGKKIVYSYRTNIPAGLDRLFSQVDGSPSRYMYTITSQNTNTITEYVVTEIDFANGKMSFDYTSGLDATNSTQLDKVHIYDSYSNELKRYTLYHTWPLLDSIQETGYYNNNVVYKPPYTFSYYSYTDNSGTYQVPPFNSYAQDFWGYFNGKTSNQDLTFVAPPGLYSPLPPVSAAYKRVPDSNYLKVGTLHTMKYPTGGITTFDFEPNQTPWTYYKQDTVYNYLSGAYVTTFNMTATDKSMTSVTFTLNMSLIQQTDAASGTTYNAKLDFTGSPMCKSGCVSIDPIVELDDLTTGAIVTKPELSALLGSNPPSTAEQIVFLNLTTGHTYKLYLTNPGTLTGSQNWTNLYDRLDATISGEGIGSITGHYVTQTVLTGGLRIRKITSSDGNGGALVKEYKYPQSYFNSPLFTGDFNATALNNFSFDGWNLLGGKNASGCGLFGRIVSHYSGNLTQPLGSASNNSASYNEVEEYQSDGNGNHNGKTVYDYMTAEDEVTMKLPFFKISRESIRGLLKEKRIYKYSGGNYMLLQDIVNTYSDLNVGYPNADTVVFYTAHALLDNSAQNNVPPITGPVGGPAYGCLGCETFAYWSNYVINRYYYTTWRYALRSAAVTNYDDNGNQLTVTSNYDYQNLVHMLPTHLQYTASDGSIEELYTSYVPDYPSTTSCVNNCNSTFAQQLGSLKSGYYNTWGPLAANFAASQSITPGPACSPLKQDSVLVYENLYHQSLTNYQNSVDSLANLYNNCVSSYNTCVQNYYTTASADQKGIIDLQNMNNILPEIQKTSYRKGNLTATLQTSYNTFWPNVTHPSKVMASTLNNPLETRLQFLAYDTHGNLKEARKAGDLPVTYVWDYNFTYPVAEVRNADISDIAYTSFEADGTGNWTIGSSARNTNGGITGNNYYSLNSDISRTGLNPVVSYIVSYWTTNTVPFSIAGTVSNYPVKGKTVSINGVNWTYFEHKVSGQSTVLLNGSGSIDELRLYPSTAQMTTYTYLPLIGTTSQCDAGSRISYYSYDGLGRLKVVKDQDGNIIKTLEYHYQGQ